MFVVLGIQHTMRTHHILICGLSCYTILFYIIWWRHDFKGKRKVIKRKSMFWFSLHIYFEIFLILRRIKRDMITNVYRSSCTVPTFLLRFNKNSIFSTDFGKNTKYQILLKFWTQNVCFDFLYNFCLEHFPFQV